MVTKKKTPRRAPPPTVVPIFSRALTNWLSQHPEDGQRKLKEAGISYGLLRVLMTPEVRDTHIQMNSKRLKQVTGLNIHDLFFSQAKSLAEGCPENITSFDSLMDRIQELVNEIGTAYITTNTTLTRFRKEELEKWKSRNSVPLVSTLKSLIELAKFHEEGKTITDRSQLVYSKTEGKGKKDATQKIISEKSSVSDRHRQHTPSPTKSRTTKAVYDNQPVVATQFFMQTVEGAIGQVELLLGVNPNALQDIPDGDLERIAVIIKKIADTFDLTPERLLELRKQQSLGQLSPELLGAFTSLR